MTGWLWMVWLGCGMPAEDAARLEALEAKVAELEAKVATAPVAPPVDAENDEAVRERRLERLRRLRAERKKEPPKTLREALADPMALLESTRTMLHRGADGAYDGFRLGTVRHGGIADRLGFQSDDVVHSVDGHPLTSVEEVVEAGQLIAGRERLEVAFSRDGEPRSLTLALDAPLPEAEAPSAEDVETTVRDLLLDRDRHARLGRALLHRGGDGEYDGYRLSAIRRNGALDLLGIKNGDTIHEVAGIPVTGMDRAEAALLAAQEAEAFDVVLTRRGERMSLTIEADAVVPADR